MKKLNILLLLVSGFISAQITTSSISGVVVDDANMELEGANVVAVHVPTGTTYGVVTNHDGSCNLDCVTSSSHQSSKTKKPTILWGFFLTEIFALSPYCLANLDVAMV